MNQPNPENYRAKRTERERKEQERTSERWYWFGQRDPVARFTLYIGLLTAGLILVGILQWSVIRGQLKEMHDGGVDTHNLAFAAKLDQRAWVGFALLTLEPPKVGDVVHASVTYINTGRTPAKKVIPLTHQKFSEQPIATEAELLRYAAESGSPTSILGVMYQGMPYSVPIDGKKPLTQIEVDGITTVLYTYLWGEVSYSDFFGDSHLMEFCAYRKGISGGFLQCPFHNQPDSEKNSN